MGLGVWTVSWDDFCFWGLQSSTSEVCTFSYLSCAILLHHLYSIKLSLCKPTRNFFILFAFCSNRRTMWGEFCMSHWGKTIISGKRSSPAFLVKSTEGCGIRSGECETVGNNSFRSSFFGMCVYNDYWLVSEAMLYKESYFEEVLSLRVLSARKLIHWSCELAVVSCTSFLSLYTYSATIQENVCIVSWPLTVYV